MLLPETKEREYRFKLALRMGLPIFALIIALISNTLITTYESLDTIFYIESILLIAFSIYFIFYIIYSGFNVKITDEASKTFTREYLYKYLKKEIKQNKNYTLMLISIDNLNDINKLYGLKNGDRVLRYVISWVSEYLKDKDIKNYPIGHIKGGDFVIGLKGNKDEYKTILELLCLKSDEFKVDEMEVSISGSITDTAFSNQLDYLIENLFEAQNKNKNLKNSLKEEDINPNELEFFVVNAIEKKKFLLMTQDVFEDDKPVIKECLVKLKTPDEKIIHQKSYMKVINKLGLMSEYDFMILEKNIIECTLLDEEIYALTISPTSLRNQKFLVKTKELISTYPRVKNKIMFIISETEYYSNINRYNSTLKSLREMGVLIAIDRLGSVHTSFLYLRDLEIDAVRFDSLYSKDIKSQKYKSVLDGFTTMAHNKGVKTWVKMLENEESVNVAKELKIDFLQGNSLASLEKTYES
jgi:EAL domain-containing protein (putative c-di-GMP-specific phosphodiesterase class I)/GGDEF domain-containing protein